MRLYRDRMDEVTWQVPSLFNNDILMIIFLEMFKRTHNEQPADTIKYTYGSLKCKWNSGRFSVCDYSESSYRFFIDYYNSLGLSCMLTFSNYDITEDMLDDYVGNSMISYLNSIDYENWVIVSSDLILDYVRKNYPHVKVEASVIKPIFENDQKPDTADYYNKLLQQYDKVVVRPETLQHPEIMDRIEDKDRVVLLVNQSCTPYCKMAKKHYRYHTAKDSNIEMPYCDFCKHTDHYDETAIDYYYLVKLIDLGFKNLKLQGRNLKQELLSGLLKEYVFEPTGEIQRLLDYVGRKVDEV